METDIDSLEKIIASKLPVVIRSKCLNSCSFGCVMLAFEPVYITRLLPSRSRCFLDVTLHQVLADSA